MGLERDRALFDTSHGGLVHYSLVELVTIHVQPLQIEWTGAALVLHHAWHQILIIRTDLPKRTQLLRRVLSLK